MPTGPELDALLNTPDSALKTTNTINKAQVQGWIREAGRKHDDAQRKANTGSTRLDAAYDAVFFCALAALASEGLRVTSRAGHHETGLRAAALVMKLPAALQDEADALKDWRNRKYQGFFDPSDDDIKDAIATARHYMEATSAWLQREKPELLK